jgi:lysophospholipase L1-like esterase
VTRPRFTRYVALGDSSTEGLADGTPRTGWRGWSRRLAERVAASEGTLLYANLGTRGVTTREIRDRQLARALAMQPDLATVFSGTNDVIADRFDLDAFTADTHAMQSALREGGATVLTFTLPDLTPLLPLARRIAPRILAMNDALRAVSRETGTRLVDFAVVPVTTDARLWHPDRIHANADGHARIAAALAEALELPGADGAWRTPLPPLSPASPLAVAWRETVWTVRHLVPWMLVRTLAPDLRTGPPAGAAPDLYPITPR